MSSYHSEQSSRIIYRGPSDLLYTRDKSYDVIRETINGWMIYDNQGAITNVSKHNNLLWDMVR